MGNVILVANWDQREAGGQTLRLLRPPVEALSQAAAGVGVANFPLDADGAVRRLTLLYPYADKSYPALALVAAVVTWETDIFRLIALASRSFALYYAAQCVVATASAWRRGERRVAG